MVHHSGVEPLVRHVPVLGTLFLEPRGGADCRQGELEDPETRERGFYAEVDDDGELGGCAEEVG